MVTSVQVHLALTGPGGVTHPSPFDRLRLRQGMSVGGVGTRETCATAPPPFGDSMTDDSEEPVEPEQGSAAPGPRRLVTLTSTKGKTPEEAAAEVMTNWQKYQDLSE